MEGILNGDGLDPEIRDRVLEAFKTLTAALDEPATTPTAKANLLEASDRAMRAVARLTLELRTHSSGKLTSS
jgi:hypothetical protein